MTGHTHIPSNDSADYHSVTFRQRHKHCKSWDREKERFFDEKQRTVFRRMTAEQRRKPMLDLRILGACRQMYEEANMLLWTTNTFSFEDSTCLKIFIDGLHSTQRNKLTRMHIDFAWKIDSALGWIRLLRPSFVSKFISLQTLYATFDHYAGETANSFQQFIVAPLTWMKMLSLRHVTVVFGDDGTSIYTSIYQRHRWAIAKKREIARGLRNKLLDPNGHEVLAAEIQAKEAEWQFPTRRRSIGDEWAVEAASRS